MIATLAAAAPYDGPVFPQNPFNPCNFGPVGVACNAVKGAIGAGKAVANFTGGIWDVMTDPVGALTKAAAAFFSAAAKLMSSSTSIEIDQKATLLVYGSVAALMLMVGVGVAVKNLGWGLNLANQVWAIPGFGLFVASLIAVPIALGLVNELVDLAVTPFTDIGGGGFNSLFGQVEKISSDNIGAFGPGSGVVAEIITAAVYLIAGVLLWLELVLRAGIILTMLVLYPVFALGFIDPARSPVGQPAGRARLHRYFDILGAVFIAKWVIAVVLALAGSLVKYGGDKGALTALGLILLVVFVPFGILAFLPVAEAAAVASGLSRAATGPLRKLGSTAKTTGKAAAAG
jgi:hypothetical protein